MKTLLFVLVATIACLALLMTGLGIKMLCHRSNSFRRPCANADTKTGRCAHCTCGKKDASGTMEDRNT